jgi:hypothetical protein
MTENSSQSLRKNTAPAGFKNSKRWYSILSCTDADVQNTGLKRCSLSEQPHKAPIPQTQETIQTPNTAIISPEHKKSLLLDGTGSISHYSAITAALMQCLFYHNLAGT